MDHILIARAEARATGANIHAVKNLIHGYVLATETAAERQHTPEAGKWMARHARHRDRLEQFACTGVLPAGTVG